MDPARNLGTEELWPAPLVMAEALARQSNQTDPLPLNEKPFFWTPQRNILHVWKLAF